MLTSDPTGGILTTIFKGLRIANDIFFKVLSFLFKTFKSDITGKINLIHPGRAIRDYKD